MLGSLRNYIFAYPHSHDLVWICVLDQIYDALIMQDDPPEYRAKVNLGWVFLALLGVQVLVRLVIHFRNPFDIPVCDRNSLAVDFATDPLIWIWAVLAMMRLNKTAPMQDDPPEDEFDGMLDDAPSTPPNMYGD
jgi:hypothetical protein